MTSVCANDNSPSALNQPQHSEEEKIRRTGTFKCRYEHIQLAKEGSLRVNASANIPKNTLSQDITTDNVSLDISNIEERKATDQSVTINTTVCNLPMNSISDNPRIKTVSIASNALEKVGEDWYTIIFINWVLRTDYNIFMFALRRWVRLIYLTLVILGLLGYTAFYILVIIYNTDNATSTYYIINVIILAFALANIICVFIKIRAVCLRITQGTVFFVSYAWIKCLYYGLTVFMTVNMFFNRMYFLSGIYFSSLYGTDLLHSTRIVLLVLFIPAIGLLSIGEAIVRAISCKLGCPYMSPKIRSYTYAVYKFGDEYVKEETKCSVCLGEYNEEDKNLVVLQCLTKHIFHEKCLLEWAKKQEYCPVCRSELIFSV